MYVTAILLNKNFNSYFNNHFSTGFWWLKCDLAVHGPGTVHLDE